MTIATLIASLPEDRAAAMKKLRTSFRRQLLPLGFREELQNDMIAYVVPHKTYPAGYHCDPSAPLPFLAIASRKNFLAVYHMGIYADPKLQTWFQEQWPRHVPTKLDMGKSCIRLKRMDTIPYGLFAELAGKVSVQEWIDRYEKAVKR